MKNDFEIACNLINKELSNEEKREIFKKGSDVEKTAIILNLVSIDNETAKLLIENLTNQSGPVREAVAFKLKEFMPDYGKYFQDNNSLDIIIKSLNDVNPNVVRFMLETLEYIDEKTYVLNSLIELVKKLSDEVLLKPVRGKLQEHIYTKKCFKIYWSLEAIKKIIFIKPDIINSDVNIKKCFFELIRQLSKIEEYTIREKIAQIITIGAFKDISDVKDILKNDDNYFVKRQIEG